MTSLVLREIAGVWWCEFAGFSFPGVSAGAAVRGMLWWWLGRLPTADEVAAWMDEDEPVTGEEVG